MREAITQIRINVYSVKAFLCYTALKNPFRRQPVHTKLQVKEKNKYFHKYQACAINNPKINKV